MPVAPVHYEDADAVAAMNAWLPAHQDVLAGFGGVAHISGVHEAPWPHLLIRKDDAGTPGDMHWSSFQGVELAVVGDPAGRYGDATCSKLLRLAIRAAKEAEGEAVAGTVIVSVGSTGSPTNLELATGAVRWRISLQIDCHPTLTAI